MAREVSPRGSCGGYERLWSGPHIEFQEAQRSSPFIRLPLDPNEVVWGNASLARLRSPCKRDPRSELPELVAVLMYERQGRVRDCHRRDVGASPFPVIAILVGDLAPLGVATNLGTEERPPGL